MQTFDFLLVVRPLYFGGGAKAPAPQPVPENPAVAEGEKAKRLDAERAALADLRSRGRQSTIFGGGLKTTKEQEAKGSAKQKQYADLLGAPVFADPRAAYADLMTPASVEPAAATLAAATLAAKEYDTDGEGRGLRRRRRAASAEMLG